LINCSKIGGLCPHPINVDENFIFVIMPFKDFDSVYDTIKQAVPKKRGIKYRIERADEKYTSFSIWCSRICKSIRKAKICIVDTTGKNPNVFYELGFTHGLTKTKTIILTQKIKDAPFDIKEMGHIVYSVKNLPKLRKDLNKALSELLREEELRVIGSTDKKPISQEEENLNRVFEEIKPELLKELIKTKLSEQGKVNIL
jgi:hypothetical protein